MILLQVAGVALAALLSENFILVNCLESAAGPAPSRTLWMPGAPA